MKFEHGHRKFGGRKLGTPNKSNILAKIQQSYPGFDPVVEMIKLYNDPDTPIELRARLLSEIASFTAPRIKAMTFTESQRLTDEAVLSLVAGESDPVDAFIQAFLDGRLSAQDLSSLVAALSLKQKPQGQGMIDEQAELLRLIKG